MKKHILWIVELLIWGLIIFSTIFAGLYIYNKNVREKHTYYVFFQDVDGLIKGSPVKIQGYQVGYISNISVVNDDAFITFIITDKELKMPENLSASVAFTGMGGSKSLELFIPPKGTKSKNYITPIEPRRLNDFYVYSNQIAQNIVTMTNDFMKMCDEPRIKMLKDFIKNPEVLKEVDNTLDIIQNSEKDFMKKRKKK